MLSPIGMHTDGKYLLYLSHPHNTKKRWFSLLFFSSVYDLFIFKLTIFKGNEKTDYNK